jgi:hypothetical protein
MKKLLLSCVCLVWLCAGCGSRELPEVQVGDSFSDACNKMVEAGGEEKLVPIDLTVPQEPPQPGEEPKPPLFWDHAIYEFKNGTRVTLTGLHGKITHVEIEEAP